MPHPPLLLAKNLMSRPPALALSGHPVPLTANDVVVVDQEQEPALDIPQLDYDLIKALFEKGLGLGHANNATDGYALDRWLAPRLHSAVRLPRRISSQKRFWAWLALKFGVEYVHQRFAEEGTVRSWRFTGDLLRNAVSRLWWAAELLRNGSDYSAVDLGLRRVRTAQFALELKYSWYRPAAIAFVEVAESPSDILTDEEMKALSRRANAYLPLAPLEAIGFDDPADSPDTAWWSSLPTQAELFAQQLPEGPVDGTASEEAVDAIEAWYRVVLDEERLAASSGATTAAS